MHYAYLDGKRVSNHLMRDCRTFLRLQEAMELGQGAKQGDTAHDRATTDQGYQIKSGTGHPQSKVYISTMIQPIPKSKKRAEKYIKESKPSNIVTTSYHRVPTMVRPNS
jgi:hypothetical protein